MPRHKWKKTLRKYTDLYLTVDAILEGTTRLKTQLLEQNLPCVCGHRDLTPVGDIRTCNLMKEHVYQQLWEKCCHLASQEVQPPHGIPDVNADRRSSLLNRMT